MLQGCYTAIISPMLPDGELDMEGLSRLVEFQAAEGVAGVLAVGTTGESPTLTWAEHNGVIIQVRRCLGERGLTIAGTGSNNTAEAIRATEHAYNNDVRAALLVDPYYNGPSSMEIRKEYVSPIAALFADMEMIPYVIPGRTGTQLLPEDLALLHKEFPNVRTVKEATGDLDNMRRTRKCCGDDFIILSGDDDKTYDMMVDPDIAAAGVISVVSNIVPGAVQKMAECLLQGEKDEAARLRDALKPLFGIVTVKTAEETPSGPVTCKARNPLAIKTLMNILGMPSGPCRRPLGRMTPGGLQTVLNAAKTVHENDPDILAPIQEAFDVNIEERLYDANSLMRLSY